jgi:glutamine amidotransferase-like uncharacterized protein
MAGAASRALQVKKIFIYRGEGADAFCIEAIRAALVQEGVDKSYCIAYAEKSLFQDSLWHEEAALLIFPGGRDIPYHQALKGKANGHIRDYVTKGGRFFGICAGGYYGCRRVEFEKGGPLEVIGERELGFFPGVAKGPAYGPGEFCYLSHKGARIASLQLKGTSASAYFNGGCAFVDTEAFSSVTVLGRYSDIEGQPAAIVKCPMGEGLAILSGVHPEYSALYEGTNKHIRGARFDALHAIESNRRKLFSILLQELQI